MTERERYFRLPNDEVTFDVNKYADAWSDLAYKIADILECKVHAMDPVISLRTDEDHVFNLPVSIVNKILEKVKP